MSDRDILEQMIRSEARIGLHEKGGSKSVVLKEPQNPRIKFEIQNMPPNSIVIKTDIFESPNSLFNGKSGECRRADYAIISAEKKCILYIEMNKSSKRRKHIINQLRGAKCVVAYCREVGRTFWDKESFLSEYQDLYVSIGHIRVHGRSIRTDTSRRKKRNALQAVHDTPEKAMKIRHCSYLPFKKIAGL